MVSQSDEQSFGNQLRPRCTSSHHLLPTAAVGLSSSARGDIQRPAIKPLSMMTKPSERREKNTGRELEGVG